MEKSEKTHLIIFDLDGTLADTRADLANAVNLTRAVYNLNALPLDQIIGYVGNGSKKLIERSFQDSAISDVDAVLNEYATLYAKHLVEKSHLYPGVEKTLKILHEKGHTLAVLSNKPGDFCRQIIDQFGLSDYFIKVLGDGDLKQLKPAPEGIFEIKQSAEQKKCALNPQQIWMVGDNYTDLEAGQNAGVNRVFCSFGFGHKAGHECDHEIAEFSELLKIVG